MTSLLDIIIGLLTDGNFAAVEFMISFLDLDPAQINEATQHLNNVAPEAGSSAAQGGSSIG